MKETVSLNQINAYLWARQGFDLQQQRTAYAVVDEIIGLYGTAPTCYLSILARSANFCFEGLDEELYNCRRLVRIRAMRVSLFLVSKRRLPAVFQATKKKCQSAFQDLIEKSGISQADYARTANQILRLCQNQPMTVSESKKALSPEKESIRRALNFIVALMCAEGRLVRAKVRGSWKSDLCEYARFEDWLPDVELESIDPFDARVVLARQYFDTFGPATAEDFQWWSGCNKTETDRTLGALKGELVPIQVLRLTGDYFILNKNREQLLSYPDELPEGAILLPAWDAYLMAYKRRERYLSRQWYDRIYDKGGNATSVVLLHGSVGGVWDMQEEKKQLIIKVALFNRSSKVAWRELKVMTERLAGAIGFEHVRLVRCPVPPPLAEGAQNRLLSPLKGIEGEEVLW